MATLTVGAASRATAGYNLTGLTAAAGGGDKFTNDGQTFLIIKNADASSHTVTPTIQQGVDGQVPANVASTILAGETHVIGPFPTAIYNDAGGFCNLTYSAVTSVTVAAVRMPPAG